MNPVWEPKALGEGSGNPSPIPMPELIWKILTQRGISNTEDINKFFKAPMGELTSPFKLKDMNIAVDRLIKAYENSEKLCIYADFDLDGTPGLALFFEGLLGFGFKEENIVPYQPSRLKEGYGLHKEAISKLKNQGVSLIVTVDLGITAVEEVDFANENGLDVVITDHHLPGDEIPRALAVVNPNQGTCPSNLGYLAGAGVAFYTLMALRSKMKEFSEVANNFSLKSLLDFFCIGTITDMVPLKGDNRILVKHGLRVLERTNKVGLRQLLLKLDLLGKDLSSQDVAMKFAPKLNALSRLESGILPIEVMLEKDSEKAKELVSKVLKTNDQRKKLQNEAEEDAKNKVLESHFKNCIWVWSEDYHQGIIGLVATRLMQQYQVPAFVGSLNAEKGLIVASGRAPKDSNVNLSASYNRLSNYFIKHGGHEKAAGFEISLENAEAIREELEKEFAKESQNEFKEYYDVEGDLSQINGEFMKWFDKMDPFGIGFEVPTVMLRNVRLVDVKELRGGHLKLRCASPDNSVAILDAIWFSPDKESSSEAVTGNHLDLLVEPTWNSFAGQKKIQLQIKGVRGVN